MDAPLVLDNDYHSPELQYSLDFLAANETDRILAALPAAGSALWEKRRGADTALRYRLQVSSEPLLPQILARYARHFEKWLGRPVDVSGVDSLLAIRYLEGKPDEELHRDAGWLYEVDGLPSHELTTLVHLTDAGAGVPTRHSGATLFPTVAPGGLVVPPKRGAMLAFSESVPHASGGLAYGHGERISLMLVAAEDAARPAERHRRLRSAVAAVEEAAARGDAGRAEELKEEVAAAVRYTPPRRLEESRGSKHTITFTSTLPRPFSELEKMSKLLPAAR